MFQVRTYGDYNVLHKMIMDLYGKKQTQQYSDVSGWYASDDQDGVDSDMANSMKSKFNAGKGSFFASSPIYAPPICSQGKLVSMVPRCE